MAKDSLSWKGFSLCTFFLLLLLGPTAKAADTHAPEASSKPTSSTLVLADLPTLSRSTQELLGRVNAHIQENQSLLRDRSASPLQGSMAPSLNHALEGRHFSETDLAQLMDLEAEFSSHSLQLNQLIESYQAATRKFEVDQFEVESELTQWTMMEGLAKTRSAPEEVLILIKQSQRSLIEGAQRIHPLRNGVLIGLAKAIESRSILDHLDAEITSKRQAIGRELLEEDRESLLALSGPNEARFQNALKALKTWMQGISQYLWVQALALLSITVVLGALSWFLAQEGASLLSEEVAFSGIARGALAISGQRIWLALLTVLLGFNLGPKGPIAFYDGVWLLILAPVTVLAHGLIGPFRWLTLYALVFALIPFPFRTILEAMPWVDRWLLNLQAALVISGLLYDLFRRREVGPFRFQKPLISAFVLGLVSLLLIGISANMMGRTGLAKELVDGVIASLGFLLVYTVALDVSFLYVAGLIRSPLGKLLRTASSDPRTLLYGAHRVLLMLTVLMVIWGSLSAFRLDAAAKSMLMAVWASELQIGRVDLPMKAILSALGVAGGTLLSLRLTRFLLDREILPRFRLAAGVPFAITALSQYAVAVLGFVLAMTSLGIDLTQISILAGAVGVGVGFGLQNIFNNFISGLILLFERPIHVGDIIELGNLRGTVTRIGIRSSTIRTPMGAEVLMPNGDLIAKEVTNWTLSDRRRRMEISISAAYGSSIPKVLDLLMDVAASREDVLEDPAPLAVFSNFGESSLDFVLYAWVERYEDTMLVASELRQCINDRFQAEAIVIPFPQRDIHIIPATD